MSSGGDQRATKAFKLWQSLVAGVRRYQASRCLEQRLDDELFYLEIDPDSFDEPKPRERRSVVCFVGTRTRAALWRLALLQAVLDKVVQPHTAESDRQLSALFDAHASDRISDAEFADQLSAWLQRPPDPDPPPPA